MKKELRNRVYEKLGGRCAYCGKKIAYKDMQVDHYLPQNSGAYAMVFHDVKDLNDISNLMPSCRRCNHYKRSHLPENFKTMIKTLHERVEKIYIAKVAIDYGIIILQPHEGIFYFEKVAKRTNPIKQEIS